MHSKRPADSDSAVPSLPMLRGQMRDVAMNRVAMMTLPSRAERETVRALEHHPVESQDFMILAALDATLPSSILGQRLASVWALVCAVNVMDDIADGECFYLPAASAPGIVVLLQGLSHMLAVTGEVGPAGIRASAEGLVRMAAGQSDEVHMKTWDISSYKYIADLIGGQQYVAYLSLLWAETALESMILDVAHLVGRVGMVARDIRTADRRIMSMCDAERAAIVGWARNAMRELQEKELCCTELLSKYAASALESP